MGRSAKPLFGGSNPSLLSTLTLPVYDAPVVKLEDTQVLGSCTARCGGSSPFRRTRLSQMNTSARHLPEEICLTEMRQPYYKETEGNDIDSNGT